MLAKYNLNVGEYKYNATEGIQNENVLGDVDGLDDRYGTVFFSIHILIGHMIVTQFLYMMMEYLFQIM